MKRAKNMERPELRNPAAHGPPARTGSARAKATPRRRAVRRATQYAAQGKGLDAA